jgi:hypothetical protein
LIYRQLVSECLSAIVGEQGVHATARSRRVTDPTCAEVDDGCELSVAVEQRASSASIQIARARSTSMRPFSILIARSVSLAKVRRSAPEPVVDPRLGTVLGVDTLQGHEELGQDGGERKVQLSQPILATGVTGGWATEVRRVVQREPPGLSDRTRDRG